MQLLVQQNFFGDILDQQMLSAFCSKLLPPNKVK